jgi:hypothetical protein
METSGLQLGQRGQQLGGGADRGGDLEPVRRQQPGQAVPQEEEIFTDDNAHGTSIATMVGPPAGLLYSRPLGQFGVRRPGPQPERQRAADSEQRHALHQSEQLGDPAVDWHRAVEVDHVGDHRPSRLGPAAQEPVHALEHPDEPEEDGARYRDHRSGSWQPAERGHAEHQNQRRHRAAMKATASVSTRPSGPLVCHVG